MWDASSGKGNRVIRRLFNLAAAVSLAVFLLSAAVWTIGRFQPTEIAFAHGGCFWDLTFSPDYFTITRIDGWPIDEPATWGHGGTIRVHTGPLFLSRYNAPLNVYFIWEGQGSVEAPHHPSNDPWGNLAKPPAPYLLIGASVKASAMVAALLPAIWFIVWFRHRTKATLRGFDVEPAGE